MAQEYVVRMPGNINKKFNIMRFNAALNMEIDKLRNCKMQREDLLTEVKEEIGEEKPEFGAGSEFGRKEREEAKRRKYEKRKNKHNNSPWILKVNGKPEKNYRGIREGGVTENASYYVFFQAPDGAFEAFPVNEWYNFTLCPRYKALSAEEAEEKFNKRDQILNFFPLKFMNKRQGDSSAYEPSKNISKTIKKEFKVSDIDDWNNSENDSENDSESEAIKPKNKRNKKGRKAKKDNHSDNEDEPLEESDEGDYDDKEVDYMSDSSNSSLSDNEKGDMKGVNDESALRDLGVSEDEEEQEDKHQNLEEQAQENKSNDVEVKNVTRTENNAKDSSHSDSEFDSDDSDLDESKSALFIQNRKSKVSKAEKAEPTSETKTSTVSNETNQKNDQSNTLKFKHKLESPSTSHVSKKQKIDKTKNEPADDMEEAVRRYLMRKPMTVADLLLKFKNKLQQRDNLAPMITEILKKLNPEKQTIKGKLHLSLRPT